MSVWKFVTYSEIRRHLSDEGPKTRFFCARNAPKLHYQRKRNGEKELRARRKGKKAEGSFRKDVWDGREWRVPSSDPRNNSGTHLGSSPLLVSKVAISPKKSGPARRNIGKEKPKLIAVQPALLFYCLFTTMKICWLDPAGSALVLYVDPRYLWQYHHRMQPYPACCSGYVFTETVSVLSLKNN